MFFVNTVSVSLGSDFLLKEFGKRISSIDLLRVQDDAVAYSIEIQNMAGESCIFAINDLVPVQREVAKTRLNRKDFLHTYPIFAEGQLIHVQKEAKIRDLDLFRAVMSGHLVDLDLTLKREERLKKSGINFEDAEFANSII